MPSSVGGLAFPNGRSESPEKHKTSARDEFYLGFITSEELNTSSVRMVLYYYRAVVTVFWDSIKCRTLW